MLEIVGREEQQQWWVAWQYYFTIVGRHRSVINELWKSQGRCSVLCCIESNLRATDCFKKKKNGDESEKSDKFMFRQMTLVIFSEGAWWFIDRFVFSPFKCLNVYSSEIYQLNVEDHHSLVHIHVVQGETLIGKFKFQSNFNSLFFVFFLFLFFVIGGGGGLSFAV